MRYILVGRCCNACGGDIAVAVFDEVPTQEEVADLVDKLGGMFCIETKLFKKNEYDKYNEELMPQAFDLPILEKGEQS